MRTQFIRRGVGTLAAAVVSVMMLSGCALITALGEPSEPLALPTAPVTTEAAPEPEETTAAPETPTPPPAPSVQGVVTDFFDLDIGDCFDIDETQDGYAIVYPDCSTEHTYESYQTIEMSGGDAYPGDDAVESKATTECHNAFQPYVGSYYQNSIYDMEWITPSQATWEQAGDRIIMCVVELYEGGTSTGSAYQSGK